VKAKREQTKRERAVEMAVAKIREFHQIGLALPPRAAHREVYNRGIMDAEAERLGMNPDTVRKARVFAHPADGYTAAELDDLCLLITQTQSGQKDSLPVFSRTHVIRLLSVPKHRRGALARRAVAKAWSSSELEQAIAARFGTRTEGGRRRRVPQDVLGLLVQIEGTCEKWGRWAAVVTPRTGPVAKEADTATLNVLPPDVHRAVQEATRAMERLHRLVVEELVRRKRRRALRRQFQPEEGGE
jgi:hypothetical protein